MRRPAEHYMANEKEEMTTMNLAEAMHYLEGRGIKKSIRELAGDILGGKLNAEQKGGRHSVYESDLENVYELPVKKLTGREYFTLKQQGLTREEIIQKMIPFYGSEKSARLSAGAFEAHITRGSYAKQYAKENDVQTHFTQLGMRDDLLKRLVETEQLGLHEEGKKIKEQMKKQIIPCRIFQIDYGLELRIPVSTEKTTALGLHKDLYDFFNEMEFYTKLNNRGISVNVTAKEGYTAFAYAGKIQQILNTIREHISAKQPKDFAKANLEAKLSIPSEFIIREIKQEKRSKAHLGMGMGIASEEIYTRGEIVKIYNLGYHGQALGGLTRSKIIKPVIISGKTYYKIITPPKDKKLYTREEVQNIFNVKSFQAVGGLVKYKRIKSVWKDEQKLYEILEFPKGK